MSPYLDRHSHPHRRATDSLGRRIRDVLRDFGVLFAIIIAATSVILQHDRVTRAEQSAALAAIKTRQVQEGRAISLDVTCAAISALVEGGRVILRASAALDGDRIIGDPRGDFRVRSGQLARFLQQHGLPGPEDRVRLAKTAAAVYALDTAAGIAVASGRADVVDREGRLDCAKLKKAARLPPAKP